MRAFGPRKRRIFGQISLRSRVAEALTRPGVDLLVMALILASLAVVIAERALAPSGGEIAWLGTIDLALTGVFAVELSIRFYAAKKKRRFFRRYWLDMLSLLPAVGALPSLRLLRLLRLFRLGLLFSRRFTFVQGLIRLNIYEVWVLVLTTLILVVGGGGLVFLFEGNSSPDFSTLSGSLWWALESIIAGEPIGPIPTSSAGRTVLVLVMLAGMTLFAVFTGVISAAMIDRLSGRKETWDMDLDELEGHVVVCGYNAGVPALLHELAIEPDLSRSPIVLVNELDEPPDPRKLGLRPELVYHVRGDHTKLELLRRVGIEKASRAVVMADAIHHVNSEDRDARTVLAALTIEKLNPKIYCTVELMDPANESHLRVAGVEAILMRNDLSGRMLATACRHPDLVNVIMELITMHRGETIHHVPGPKKATAFGELMTEVKRARNALPIAVERDGQPLRINPPHDFLVEPTDYLVVISGPRDSWR